MPNTYDYILFETLTNAQLAEIYNVSKQCISLQRKKHAPHTDSLQILFEQNIHRIDDKILDYIKTNSSNVNILEFKKINSIFTSGKTFRKSGRIHFINRERFLRIANENDIKINFVQKYYPNNEHGMHCIKKCKCVISRLANSIRNKAQKSKISKYKNLSFKIINFIANKYISLYNEINPFKNRGRTKLVMNFYVKIFEEIDKLLDIKNLSEDLFEYSLKEKSTQDPNGKYENLLEKNFGNVLML